MKFFVNNRLWFEVKPADVNEGVPSEKQGLSLQRYDWALTYLV